jgi:type VI secretion system secreted protein VgrG
MKQFKFGQNATENVGVAKVVDVGETILIKAGTSITLECGASRIHMNQAGFITITGTVITTTAAVNASVSAPLTEITGGVLLTMFGGVSWVESAKLTRISSQGQTDVVAVGDTIIKGKSVKIN